MDVRPTQTGGHDAGASAVEYGLIVFAIAAVIAVAVFALGIVTEQTYHGSCDTFRQQAEGQAC